MATGSSDWSAGVDNYPMISGDRLFCDQRPRPRSALAQRTSACGRTPTSPSPTSPISSNKSGWHPARSGYASTRSTPAPPSRSTRPTARPSLPSPATTVLTSTAGGDSEAPTRSSTPAPSRSLAPRAQPAGHCRPGSPDDWNQPIQLTSVNLPTFDALDQWSIDRDHEVLNSQSAQYVNPETPGAIRSRRQRQLDSHPRLRPGLESHHRRRRLGSL